jgi:hypothetical protein
MFTLTLVVLSQVAVPLVPAEPPHEPVSVFTEQAAPKGSVRWVIATPILGGAAGALGGLLVGLKINSDRFGGNATAATTLTGSLIGAGVGSALGLLAGYFARQGSLAGRIASIAVLALGTSALGFVVGTGALVGLETVVLSRAPFVVW